MPSLLQKNKRRSKKDKSGRNYICGCAKTYLSYPALYTHIKNKHEGVPPKGTTLQPQSRVKPGRPPKRTDSPSKRSDGDQSAGDDENDRSLSDRPSKMSNLDFTPIKHLDEGSRFFPLRKEVLGLEDLVFFQDIGCCFEADEARTNPTETFLREKNSITNQFILHPLVDIINALQTDAPDEAFFASLNCDKAFALYLASLARHTNQTCYDMVCLLVRALRQCLNDKGYHLLECFARQNANQKIELLKESTDLDESGTFSKIEPPWYVTVCFDYFVKDYLPTYLTSYDFNLALVCSWLKSFSDWMVRNNLSKIKCTFFSFFN